MILYGAESATIMKADRWKIEAFETWCWRRALKVSWTERVTNEEVCWRIHERRSIWTRNKPWSEQKKWMGYRVRNSTRITTIIKGKPEGNPGIGVQNLDFEYRKRVLRKIDESRNE